MAKYINYGGSLLVDPAGGASYTTIAQVDSIGPLSPATDSVDVTTYDSSSSNMDFIPGLKDPGTVEATLTWDAAAATAITLSTLWTSRAIATWKWIHADGAKYTAFSGFVTSFSPQGGTAKDKQSARVSIKATGTITWPA